VLARLDRGRHDESRDGLGHLVSLLGGGDPQEDSLQVIWLARVDAEQEASIGATVASIQADKQKQADDAVAAAEAAKEHEREQAERQAAWAGVAKIVSDTGQSVTDALRARAASQAAPTAVQAAPVAAPVSGGAAVTCPAGLVGPQCCEPGTTNDRHCCTGAGGIGTQGRLVAGQACQYFCDCDQSVYNPGQSPSVDACVRGACAAAANRFCRLPENGQAEIPCIPGLVCRHVNGNSERTCVQP